MKVLLAVDGSKYARWGIEWLARLPFAKPPQAVAVHVVDVGAVRAPFVPLGHAVGIEPYIQAEVRRLEKRAKQIKVETEAALGGPGRVKIVRGPAAATLLRHAIRARLIIIGHRGLDAVDRFLLGGTSEKVVHHAPCSVLVVKQPARRLRRILLATDGSPTSTKALRFLLRELRPAENSPIEVTVVHVMPLLNYPELRRPGNVLLARYSKQLTAAGYRVRELPELGKASEQILETAERLEPDLVVVGARGLGALGRLLLGSVSTRLVQHAPCSVLVVR